MLFEVSLENFKPFAARQVAPLSKINLVYGPNSGGKSSLLQALLLMKQTLDGSGARGRALIPRGEYVDLGSFLSLLHRHKSELEFTISLSFDRPQLRRGGARWLPKDEPRSVALSYRTAKVPGSQRNDSSELTSVRYAIGAEDRLRVNLRRVPGSGKTRRSGTDSTALPSEMLGREAFEWASEADRLSYATFSMGLEKRRRVQQVSRTAGEPEDESALSSELEFAAALQHSFVVADRLLPGRLLPSLPDAPTPDQRRLSDLLARTSYAPLESLTAEFEAILDSLVYLGPLRSHPARHYLVLGGEKLTVGVRGENTPQMILGRKDEVTKLINYWFERFEIPYTMKVKQMGDALTGEIIVMQLVDRETKVKVGPSDVGFGIGQLLPIIVQGLVASGRIVCVEQPEIHLHPKLQAHIADFLIETTNGPKQGNQWIIETHSEALLLRLQKKIRQGKLDSQDVSVLYVKPDPKGSRILNLRLEEHGEFIDEWPGGFFEERYEEQFGGAA